MNQSRDPNESLDLAASVRAAYARNVGLLLFVMLGAFVAVVLTSAHASVRYSSEVAVQSAEEQTRAELVRFFSPFETQLNLLVDWSKDGVLSIESPESLNQLLIPILRSQSAATSLLLATDDGREYMLLKTPDGWLNRRVDRLKEPLATHWTRLSRSGRVIETYAKDLDYNPTNRPWFIGAQKAPGKMVWTEPYVFFTTQDPGITVAVRVQTPTGPLTIGLDLLLQDISAYTTALHATTPGAVAVTTASGKVLGLPRDPRFETREQHKSAILTSLSEMNRPALAAALDSYQEKLGGIHRVMIDQDPWWITATNVQFSNLDLMVMVAIPESSFHKPIRTQQSLMLVIISIALLAGIALTWRTNRRLADITKVDFSRRVLGSFSLGDLIVSTPEVEVYRAEHDSLQRSMIIKIFKNTVSNDITTRLKQLQKITDPHAGVPVEFGVTPDGTFFQADFDYGGVTLKDLLASGPLELERAIDITRQICIALTDAHSHGVVHGNLRPSNVIIERRGTKVDFTRVVDFSLALGQTDAALNAGFVAPECIENSGTPSPACDVYSVGALLYQMVNHRSAFTGQTSTTILMKQLTEPPSEIEEHVPEPIKELLSKCLERRPEERATLATVLTTLSAKGFPAGKSAAVDPPANTLDQNRTPA